MQFYVVSCPEIYECRAVYKCNKNNNHHFPFSACNLGALVSPFHGYNYSIGRPGGQRYVPLAMSLNQILATNNRGRLLSWCLPDDLPRDIWLGMGCWCSAKASLHPTLVLLLPLTCGGLQITGAMWLLPTPVNSRYSCNLAAVPLWCAQNIQSVSNSAHSNRQGHYVQRCYFPRDHFLIH